MADKRIRGVVDKYFEEMPPAGRLSRCDHFLAYLWGEGYKVASNAREVARATRERKAKRAVKKVAKGFHGHY